VPLAPVGEISDSDLNRETAGYLVEIVHGRHSSLKIRRRFERTRLFYRSSSPSVKRKIRKQFGASSLCLYKEMGPGQIEDFAR
jgi:hypothetical protein